MDKPKPKLPSVAEMVESSWPDVKAEILAQGTDPEEFEKGETGLKGLFTVMLGHSMPHILDAYANGVEFGAEIARIYADGYSASTETAQACQTATKIAVALEESAVEFRADFAEQLAENEKREVEPNVGTE